MKVGGTMQNNQDKEQSRNMILFFAITMLIMLIYPHVFGPDQSAVSREQIQTHMVENAEIRANSQILKQDDDIEEEVTPIETIRIDAQRISGTISTKGLQFNDVILKDYIYQDI